VHVCDGYRHGIRAWEKEKHPTQKWLPMIQYIVGCIVKPDGCALDPFMGSGTTGVACIRTGRRFIGIEISEDYYAIALARIRREWETYQGGPMFAPKVNHVSTDLLGNTNA
jgi:DNA modification methylase